MSLEFANDNTELGVLNSRFLARGNSIPLAVAADRCDKSSKAAIGISIPVSRNAIDVVVVDD
jgi:hypothetical protein